MKIYDTTDIRDAADRAGSNWFSPGTMRFFNCRVDSNVYPDTEGGYYFISSERYNYKAPRLYNYKAPRLYTVRYWHLDAPKEVNTIGDFQQYTTKARALGHIRTLLKGASK